MTQQQKGRVAVVTGAAKGLGQAYAVRLAQDGCNIAIGDLSNTRETVDLIKQTGKQVFTQRCDMTSMEDVTQFAQSIQQEFGRIDILVNNVGIYPFISIHEMTFENWRKVMATNLDSVFLLSKAFYPAMKHNMWGRIINISSSSIWMVAPNCAHYIASKMGVIGLTRALATELAEFGITANALAPGLTHTPGTDGGAAAAFFADMPKMQAIKRGGTTGDLVGAVSFLASDEAAFITGQTLVIDGGMIRI